MIVDTNIKLFEMRAVKRYIEENYHRRRHKDKAELKLFPCRT